MHAACACNPSGIWRWSLYGLGNAYHAIGNFGEALSYLERSLELRPAQQDPRNRAITLRTLANVLGDTGRGREAIARREEALRTTQIPPEKARITLELIEDRIEVGDLAIAKSLAAPLLAARDLPDPAVRIGATLASARIALAEGDAGSAARDARAAADYYQAHELVSSEFEALLVRARAACAAGARDEALDIAESALQRAEEDSHLQQQPDAARLPVAAAAAGVRVHDRPARAHEFVRRVRGGRSPWRPCDRGSVTGQGTRRLSAQVHGEVRYERERAAPRAVRASGRRSTAAGNVFDRRSPRTMRDWQSCAPRPPAFVAKSICRVGCPPRAGSVPKT